MSTECGILTSTGKMARFWQSISIQNSYIFVKKCCRVPNVHTEKTACLPLSLV